MKYYLIAGEASGDLHASRLMLAILERDPGAQFRFIGGDQMKQVADGCTGASTDGTAMVRHYRDMAYMGFVPVLLHLPTILRNMRLAKHDIMEWQPDALILVDYPGFNLSIAKYVRSQRQTAGRPTIFYYIAPKIWAWKEYRIKNIKRDVDQLLSILPFEVYFFEKKHHYPIHYVGNPTADEVRLFKADCSPSASRPSRPVIAVLCGSRRQEIRDNLPAMLQVTDRYAPDYQIVVAGAPAIPHEYYQTFLQGHRADIVFGQTYQLLDCAHAALVTSGTATLETALFGVPQVVCYETSMAKLFGWLKRHVLKVKYVSLVNLIADREVVPELVADTFSVENIDRHLRSILSGPAREAQLRGYDDVRRRLGNNCAPDNAADIITQTLSKKSPL